MVEQLLLKHLPQLMLLVIMYIMVVVCVFLDLWAGVRKAKRAGTFDGSFGIRKTVEKLLHYLNLLLVLTAVDAMVMVATNAINEQLEWQVPVLPFLTIVGAIFSGAVEVYSVYESAEKKERAKMRDTARLIATLAANQNTQELAQKVADLINKKKEASHENE